MRRKTYPPESFTDTQTTTRRRLHTPLIVLQTSEQFERRAFFGYAKNLSMGGMFIASINPPPPGRKFAIEFALPSNSGHKVRCTSEVVWNRTYSNRGKYEPGMGMRFIDIPDDMASAIDKWANTVTDPTPVPVM